MELLLADAKGAEVRIWPILSCMQCNLYVSLGTAGISYGLCNAGSSLPERLAISIAGGACCGETRPCPHQLHLLWGAGILEWGERHRVLDSTQVGPGALGSF